MAAHPDDFAETNYLAYIVSVILQASVILVLIFDFEVSSDSSPILILSIRLDPNLKQSNEKSSRRQ